MYRSTSQLLISYACWKFIKSVFIMHNMDYRENIDSHLDKFKALLFQGKSAEDILSSEGSLK